MTAAQAPRSGRADDRLVHYRGKGGQRPVVMRPPFTNEIRAGGNEAAIHQIAAVPPRPPGPEDEDASGLAIPHLNSSSMAKSAYLRR